MSGNAFRGVSAEQDARFGNKEKKLLKSLAKTFPPEYSVKVDMNKINWEAMKVWIAKRLTELLGGVEDDVLIGYVFEQLEGKKAVDPRLLQINLTGFLERNTSCFCSELWNLLISAANNPSGIPQKFLDEKAAEMQERNVERQKMQERLQFERNKQGQLRADYAVAGDRERKSRWDRDDRRLERKRSRSRSRSREQERRRKTKSAGEVGIKETVVEAEVEAEEGIAIAAGVEAEIEEEGQKDGARVTNGIKGSEDK
ncbi:hypothetical protein Ndes2526B_g03075 [Nannochloris sp. 'desiccata']